MKSRLVGTLEKDSYKQIGIFLSGGRSGGTNAFNSLLTDAAYFHSVYQDDNETMVLCGIPTLDSPHSYSANISALALGFSTTDYPEAVYDLIRYLMDYEYRPYYGFSVNRTITDQQLENIQSTTTKIYPDSLWGGLVGGYRTMEEIESQSVTIQPLTSEYVDVIQDMLNHISGAGLPFSTLEYTIYSTLLNQVGDGKMSPTEAGDWAIERLHEYLENYNDDMIKPFYDSVYLKSLTIE